MVNIFSRERGYTLIEMMLVAIIIGVAALYTVGFMKRTQRDRAISGTVTRIENIMKISIAYHADYDVWPEKNSDLVNAYSLSDNSFCTVWPGATSNANAVCPNRAMIQVARVNTSPSNDQDDQDDRTYSLFEVSLTVNEEVKQVSQLLAAALPSGYLSEDNTKVTTYATSEIGFMAEDNVYGYITNAGFARTGDNIPLATECLGDTVVNSGVSQRKDMERHAFLGMFYGLTDYKQWHEDGGIWGVFSDTEYHRYMMIIGTKATNNGSTVTLTGGNSSTGGVCDTGDESCDLGYTFSDGDANVITDPESYVYYMSLCLPRSMWQAAFVVGDTSGTSNEQSQMDSVAVVENYGQCKNTWAAKDCNLGYGNSIYNVIW